MLEIQYDPLQKRHYTELADEPGRPIIIADTPQQIEEFWNDVEAGRFWREQNEAA